MRDTAISPDFATVLIALIRELRPGCVVEAGSGVSTVIAAYALKGNGCGRMISLDHDAGYAMASSRELRRHSLDDIVSVRYAPIVDVRVNGTVWPWYDPGELADVASIDLLIIDGPPGKLGRLARYPALPILIDRLSDNAVVLLDDSLRRDESEMVDMWLREFTDILVEKVRTEKGAAILRRTRERSSG